MWFVSFIANFTNIHTGSHSCLLLCFLFVLVVSGNTLFVLLYSLRRLFLFKRKKHVLLGLQCQAFFSVLCANALSLKLISSSSMNLSYFTMNYLLIESPLKCFDTKIATKLSSLSELQNLRPLHRSHYTAIYLVAFSLSLFIIH